MGDTAKKHIEEIRKDKFWIGVGKNPLRKTLRMAVKYLSAELYSKDVHFLMELIQNAEDNEYPEGVEPSLEFLITSKDLTATGAPATLLIFNNEKGFLKRNMESICDVGDSTKAGNRKKGYIGEKGIGFKSVFLLTAHPYIFSNGYQIRFSEAPCPECDISYIVPEWVDNPSTSDIHKVYGRDRILPTTTLILPLKSDKVKAVKEQLSSLHPELLLFLAKIKRLSVKEVNDDPAVNTIRAISISTERDFLAKKNIDAESYTVYLTAEEDRGLDDECFYYMWRQRFPVKKENKVEKRMDVEEWAITLAFPYGKRLNRGKSSPGIYAFLPTETVTNMPFIIQADFLLPSSRETILWDNIWNLGILDCIPTAFVHAFVSLVRTSEDAPVANLASRFSFLPVEQSCHPKLEAVRESIKKRILLENILPSESQSNQKVFHKPSEVGRLIPSFWKILLKAKEQRVSLQNLSSQRMHILHSSFDVSKYNDVLNFLNVKHVGNEWYSKCIQSCNLVCGVGEEVYIELLRFLAVNWVLHFDKTCMGSTALLKYVDASGNQLLLSVNEAANVLSGPTLCRSQEVRHISWMIDCSKEFGAASKLLFLSKEMQEGCIGVESVLNWLRDYAKVETLSIFKYASLLQSYVKNTSRMVFAFAHFVRHSFLSGYLSKSKAEELCDAMPLVNSNGGVTVRIKGILVPANGSKWVELLGGSNPWEGHDYVVLSNEYLYSGCYAGHFTPEKELIKFLKAHAGASDIPDIYPPDAAFPTVYGPLTKENAFLLLVWIRKQRSKGIKLPDKFLNCIKKGSWLKVTMSGSSGYKPPEQSFLPNSSWGSLLQNGSEMVDIPLVDQCFYGRNISDYEEELKAIGVMFEYSQACSFIGKRLMSLATEYNLTRAKVIAMLHFIRFLREKYLSVEDFVNSVKKVKWVKTSCGERSPVEAVLFDDSWKSASAISNIPFLDQGYYGADILRYKTELNLLGITLSFQDNFKLVIDHLKPSTSLNGLLSHQLIFALRCICHSSSSGNLVTTLKGAKCLKTHVGFKYPVECFLLDHIWGCILKIFDSFPYIDSTYYGEEIFQYKQELRKIGVVVDFDAATKAFISEFKKRASSNSITKENGKCFISCYKKLKNSHCTFSSDLTTCIKEFKWLRTRLGDCRSPKDCILFNADWQSISRIALLPFIDDSEGCYGNGIHDYRHELEKMGVVIDFKKGSKFVLSHIFFPQYPTDIAPESVVSLLECVRNFRSGIQDSLLEAFLGKVCQKKWLKTTYGYMSPKECLLFDPERKFQLERNDGPFIDEEHYGSKISSYLSELAAVGVITDMSSSGANLLLASHIESLCDFSKIERIYKYLSQSDWEPDDGVDAKIWIPTSSNDGFWAIPEECVIHDDNNLFGSRLHVLDQKKYKPELLNFFAKVFGVRSKPSKEDFCKLWKEWESSSRVISLSECCAFWGNVIKHWSNKSQKYFAESIDKIPAASSDSGDVMLVKKQNIFLPDDLLLKDIFEESCSYPLFVWCPMRSVPSIPRTILLNIYSEIGVRKISDSVETSQQTALDHGELKQINMKDAFIVKGLVKIILGFLADPLLKMEVKHRHEAVKMLLNVKVFETLKPVVISYSLKMSSSDIVTASTSQMVRWERENSEFFVQKLDRSGGKNVIEYATKFSEVVSKGLLFNLEDHIYGLSELIKVGFLMDFDDEAVTYFMKSKNLYIFPEDEELLSSVFPADS